MSDPESAGCGVEAPPAPQTQTRTAPEVSSEPARVALGAELTSGAATAATAEVGVRPREAG